MQKDWMKSHWLILSLQKVHLKSSKETIRSSQLVKRRNWHLLSMPSLRISSELKSMERHWMEKNYTGKEEVRLWHWRQMMHQYFLMESVQSVSFLEAALQKQFSSEKHIWNKQIIRCIKQQPPGRSDQEDVYIMYELWIVDSIVLKPLDQHRTCDRSGWWPLQTGQNLNLPIL